MKILAYGENGPWKPGEVLFRYETTDIFVFLETTDLHVPGYDQVLLKETEPIGVLCTAEITPEGFVARWYFDELTAEEVVVRGRLFTNETVVRKLFPDLKDLTWVSGTIQPISGSILGSVS